MKIPPSPTMEIPASDHFSTIPLSPGANLSRDDLPDGFALDDSLVSAGGSVKYRGIPFDIGAAEGNNAILLDKSAVEIALPEVEATYLVFLHTVENRVSNYADGFADFNVDGNELGDPVSDYVLEYADGQSHTHPILRRFAIQQSTINWGASPFAAIPFNDDAVKRATGEDIALGLVPVSFGRGECRTYSGREMGSEHGSEHLWLYALPNPHPEIPLAGLRLEPRDERSIVFGISATRLTDHPLRREQRRKLLLTLPENLSLNAIGEVDDIAIDLGIVISARQQFVYSHEAWNVEAVDVQPTASETKVVVEYTAHPAAKLYVGADPGTRQVCELANLESEHAIEIAPAHRPIKIRVIDKSTRQPIGVRLHVHGEAGEYLPPRGYHRRVNIRWFEDYYAEFANQHNQYVYIDGVCQIDVPLGSIYVEITRGYEVSPVRRRCEITADTDILEFELERVLDWRGRGWVTADTHVHFLNPATAQLEGSAEDINVVNILASQWGEMFSNVGDFDGKSTYGAVESGGSGEFLARVGSENRMQVLGHISLLGYSGEMIHPLCSGGPSESALGDPQEVTMAEWAQRCIDQGGLVVMPHAPKPQCERAADIALGLVHAVEMMTFSPFKWQISRYGLADWYRYLNLGYHLPVCGGSDKMCASSLLGGVRTYTQLGDREFTYENWMDAMRAGNTFVTVGPLAEITVEGNAPGSVISLPENGGTVNVSWNVESVRLPIGAVEVIEGGLVRHESTGNGALRCSGSVEVSVENSTWIALRVRGSYHNDPKDIAAHTSAVQVIVGDKPVYSPKDAADVLRQIEGAIAFVDTIATRPDADRYRRLRATLEKAHNRLHQRMHEQGVYHKHSPLHHHEAHHEH